MSRVMRIPFLGGGAGSAPLTWGQRHIWQAMRERDSALPMSAVRTLSAADTLDDLAAELRFYASHHHSMRTRLRFANGGEPRQVLLAGGVQPLHVIDVETGEDPDAAAEVVMRRFERAPYDYAGEQPLRAAVVRHAGVPARLVLTMSHLAMDAGGAAVMFGSRDPRTGGLRAPLTAPQPMALAEWEASPAARRMHDAAMAYWGPLLRRIPPVRFPPPVSPPPHVPRYAQVSYESGAIALAQQAVAARTGASPAAVLLTAFAVALARVTGIHPVVTQVTVNNRFRSRLAEVVAPVSQPGLCVLDIAGLPFDAAVAQAVRGSLAAYKHAYYDRRRLNELVATVGEERGHPIDLACVYNDRRPMTAARAGPRPDPGAIRAALPSARLRWHRRLDRFNEKLMLTVDQTPRAVRLLAEVDTHHLPAAGLEALLRGIEAVLVDAA